MGSQIESIPYFNNAKVGNGVICTEKGKGKISFVSTGKPKLISVSFMRGGYWIYSIDGKSTDNSDQTLFYDQLIDSNKSLIKL